MAFKDTALAKALKEHRLMQLLQKAAELAASRFKETNVVEVASSMTLATILSIVPLLAVALAMFSVVPAFESYRQSLEQFLVSIIPGEYSIQIYHYLQSFSSHAKGLSAFGFAGLGVSAYFLIDRLFNTFNKIFRVRHRRPVIQSAILYWAMLTLGPMMIVASLSVTTYLAKLALSGVPSSAATWGLNGMVLLLQACFYAALYSLVPNCYVKWQYALTAGVITAAAGQAVKWGFSIYISGGTLANLYGAFVALPVFMLWIYVSWILVFGGAAIAATLPMLRTGRFADGYKSGNSFATGVALLAVLLKARDAESPVVSVRELCAATDSWPEAVESVLERLAPLGYVSEVKNPGKKKGAAWVLIANPETATLKAAFNAISLDPTIKFFRPENAEKHPWYGRLEQSSALNLPLRTVLLTPKAPAESPEILKA